MGRMVTAHLQALHDCDRDGILVDAADDLRLGVPGVLPEPLCGRQAVQAWMEMLLAATIHERDVPVRRLEGTGCVMDESVWQGRVVGSLLGIAGHGRRISQRVIRIFEFEDERLSRLTIWLDPDALRKQLAEDAPASG